MVPFITLVYANITAAVQVVVDVVVMVCRWWWRYGVGDGGGFGGDGGSFDGGSFGRDLA